MKKKANEPSYTVSLSYDADGNMTSDGRFHYFWNGENRLVCASNAEVVLTYAYDHRGRMVRKEISHRGTEARRIEYLWDDWNIIRVPAVQKMMARIIRPLKTNAQNSIIDVEEANYAVRFKNSIYNLLVLRGTASRVVYLLAFL